MEALYKGNNMSHLKHLDGDNPVIFAGGVKGVGISGDGLQTISKASLLGSGLNQLSLRVGVRDASHTTPGKLLTHIQAKRPPSTAQVLKCKTRRVHYSQN